MNTHTLLDGRMSKQTNVCTDRQTDRWIDRPTGWRGNNEWKDRQTKNTDRLKDWNTDRQTEKQTDRLTYNQKQRDGLMHGQMDKHILIDRRIYRHTGRQKDGQTGSLGRK